MKDCKASGIELCKRRSPNHVPSDPDASTYVDTMDLDFDDKSSSSTPLSSISSNGAYKVPHVLITLQLEEDQPLDARQCARWLDNFPLLAKWVKVEAVFPSYSTLLILAVPIPIWDMMPDHRACFFIGYVTGPSIRSTEVLSVGGSTRGKASDQWTGDVAQDESFDSNVPPCSEKIESAVIKYMLHEGPDCSSEYANNEPLSNRNRVLARETKAMPDVGSSGIESGSWMPLTPMPSRHLYSSSPESLTAPEINEKILCSLELPSAELLDETEEYTAQLKNPGKTSTSLDKRARVSSSPDTTAEDESITNAASPAKKKMKPSK